MALAPEWMSYTKEISSSQGARFLGRERERGAPKYGRQLSHNNLSRYTPSSSSSQPSAADILDRKVPSTPFACSVSSPPAPPHTPSSILGDPPSRVLNRSKSSPGFASPKSNKAKKSPDRNFPTFNKPKPKPPKPSLPPSYNKSLSQPNLLIEKTTNWNQQKLQQSPSASNIPSIPSPLATSHTVSSPPPPPQPPSTSPPLPPSSPPPTIIPEIDKLKHLVPATGMPPKSVRNRGVVGPPLPLAKKPPPSISAVSSTSPASPSLQQSPSTSSVAAPPAALASYFRKATSEPSLMHHKAQGTQIIDAAQAAVRRDAASKKARAMESEKAQMLLLKEAVSARQPKRSNFFQHLIKKEELGEPLVEDESPVGPPPAPTPAEPEEDEDSSSPSPSPPLPSIPSSPPVGLRSPLPEDMEDEERFLRTLGWVPDEEDPVPVLAEEEIADVRIKIILSKQRAQHDSLSMGINVGVK